MTDFLDERSDTELFMERVLNEGRNIETLIEHPGWKHLITALEQDAIDAWLELKDVDPYKPEEIIKIQNKIKCFSMLLEKAAGFLQDKKLIMAEQ